MKFQVPVSIFYGDSDWMKNVDENSASEVILQNKAIFGSKSNLIEITDSGHNLHMDNPDRLANEIIRILKI